MQQKKGESTTPPKKSVTLKTKQQKEQMNLITPYAIYELKNKIQKDDIYKVVKPCYDIWEPYRMNTTQDLDKGTRVVLFRKDIEIKKPSTNKITVSSYSPYPDEEHFRAASFIKMNDEVKCAYSNATHTYTVIGKTEKGAYILEKNI